MQHAESEQKGKDMGQGGEKGAPEKLTSKTKPFLSDLRDSCVPSKSSNGALDAVHDNSHAGKPEHCFFLFLP